MGNGYNKPVKANHEKHERRRDMETTKPAERERKEKMEELLSSYRSHLENQEKSANTVEKYVRDVRN